MSEVGLPEYCSDSDPDEETTRLKRPRETWSWVFEKKFENEESAMKFVDAEKTWSISSTKELARGTTTYFRCREGKFRQAECPASIYLLFHDDSQNVTLYRTEAQHAHDNVKSKYGIPKETKNAIDKLFENGTTVPSVILASLRKDGIEEPKMQQLNNYLARVRKTISGPASIGIIEVRDWCDQRSKIPQDLDQPFVLSYKAVATDLLDKQRGDLKIFFTTPRLLEQSRYAKIVHVDSTYKLNWQGYPVLIIGTTDMDRHFHPFGLAVCYSETAEDFEFIFKTLKDYCSNELGFDFKPEKLQADAADAITNGFEAVFTHNYDRLMCWFHVKKKVKENTKGLATSVSNQLKLEIDAMQLCSTQDAFDQAVKLFFKKWEGDSTVNEFIEYFKRQWIDKNSLWFEGASGTLASTNNGLEGTNSALKQKHTYRKRLPVGQFLSLVETKILPEWSYLKSPMNPNLKVFSTFPSISLDLWTKSYKWAVKSVPILKVEQNCTTFYRVQGSVSLEAKDVFSQQFSDDIENKFAKWSSFPEFMECRNKMWTVRYISGDWKKSECNCPKFFKEYLCKHVLGIALRLKEVRAPEEAKSVPLGQKRKRGRPSLAKAALIKE